MGGGGWDWQDQEAYRERKAIEESQSPSNKTLDDFSDKELQEELRKRKAHAKTEAERKAAKEKHNAPIEQKIAELHQEINRLKDKLKK